MTAPAVPQVRLAVGDLVRLDGNPKRWRVAAMSRHFAVLVQQAPFKRAGVLQYTVLDWRNGVRGPCNLIGQGYGDGTYSDAECATMLAEFEAPRTDVNGVNWGPLEVSHRNRVALRLTGVNT